MMKVASDQKCQNLKQKSIKQIVGQKLEVWTLCICKWADDWVPVREYAD